MVYGASREDVEMAGGARGGWGWRSYSGSPSFVLIGVKRFIIVIAKREQHAWSHIAT